MALSATCEDHAGTELRASPLDELVRHLNRTGNLGGHSKTPVTADLKWALEFYGAGTSSVNLELPPHREADHEDQRQGEGGLQTCEDANAQRRE